MKIEMTPEQVQIIRTFMEAHAAHSARQATEFRVQEITANGLAGKLAAGSTEFNEAEIRLLLTFVQGIDVFRGMHPTMFTEEGAALLRELQPRVAAAKAKLDN